MNKRAAKQSNIEYNKGRAAAHLLYVLFKIGVISREKYEKYVDDIQLKVF
jgi:hypothetical protein